MCFLQISTGVSIQSLSKEIHVGVVITAWGRSQLSTSDSKILLELRERRINLKDWSSWQNQAREAKVNPFKEAGIKQIWLELSPLKAYKFPFSKLKTRTPSNYT